LAAWFSSVFNGTCRCCSFLGWLCLGTPCSCAPARLTCGTAWRQVLVPLLVGILLLCLPRIYLHELAGHGIEPELPAVYPLFDGIRQRSFECPLSGFWLIVGDLDSSAFRCCYAAASSAQASGRLSLLNVAASCMSSLLSGSPRDAVRSPVASGLAGLPGTFMAEDWANLDALSFFISFTALFILFAARLLALLGQAEIGTILPACVPCMASVVVVVRVSPSMAAVCYSWHSFLVQAFVVLTAGSPVGCSWVGAPLP